jgi:hypothetical protein
MTFILLFSLLIVFGLMGYITYLDFKFEAQKSRMIGYIKTGGKRGLV